MHCLWFPIFALALSASSSAELTAPKLELHNLTQVKTERVAIGSVADISPQYENGKPITVVHILEFRIDVFPTEPRLLQVRLCGYLSERLAPAVHTNITLIYDLASQSRLTGCLRLLSAEPWQETSKWQTVTFTPNTIKRGVELEKSIQAILNGASAHSVYSAAGVKDQFKKSFRRCQVISQSLLLSAACCEPSVPLSCVIRRRRQRFASTQ